MVTHHYPGNAALIHVCLVEDQTLVREGLESLLRFTDDICLRDYAADGEEALQVIEKAPPDVLLLDLRMPRMDGLTLLRQLAKGGTQPIPPTIILTTFDDDISVIEGIRLGAKGYLLKDVSFAKLTEAIRTVASGGTLISPVVTERLVRGLQNSAFSAAQKPVEHLTTRETEVLRLMTTGFSNEEIATALNLAEGTIKNHVSNILSKLGVRDRVRAVLRAIEMGYV
jgi:DNA-binding NarL/FixJ family response regulator